MTITSLENKIVKEVNKLKQKKYRDSTKKFVVEGEHLVEEVLKENIVDYIIIVDGFDYNYKDLIVVSREVMMKISSLDTPSNIMAICNQQNDTTIKGDKILLLDDIQDPGNLGTIIRSSLAFNISTIVLSENSVDLYNPKVLRATQGMFSHLTIIRMDLSKAIQELKLRHIPVYGTSVNNGIDCKDLIKEDKYALVMGNEGRGVNSAILSLCDKNLYIKMNKKVESLNVGVACSILLYELDN